MTHAELMAQIALEIAGLWLGTREYERLRALREVAKLHTSGDLNVEDCYSCDRSWPCPTWEAVAEAFK
jgi:hypothetical protein